MLLPSQREVSGMGDVAALLRLLLGLVAEDQSAAVLLASGVRIEQRSPSSSSPSGAPSSSHGVVSS
jgi:hypothetical protein